jgi:phospholipase/lecithinase/hemolysin
MKLNFICWMSLAAGMWVTVSAAPAAYTAIYAFGDSLTDTGREPAEPLLHYDGRWSNGPLWVEYLSEWLLGGYQPEHNFAHSGAQTDDTYKQTLEFVPANDVGNALFVVWAGGNDFLQEYDEHWFDDSSWDRQIAYSVSSLANAVVHLYDKGARFVLVPNTVDITKIPLINPLPDFLLDYLRGKVRQFNHELATALSQIQDTRPALTLYHFDFYTAVNSMLHNASAYGFTETETDALSDFTLLDKRFDGPGADYVFWDPIHPTTKSHRIIAGWFQTMVYPVPSTATVRVHQGRPELWLTGLSVGRRYQLRSTVDFVHWSNLQTIQAEDPSTAVVLPNNAPYSFFIVASE